MVLQDTWLYKEILLWKIYVMDVLMQQMRKLLEAAKAAHANHFIETLPGGFITWSLTRMQAMYPQGQKQLLTIARGNSC